MKVGKGRRGLRLGVVGAAAVVAVAGSGSAIAAAAHTGGAAGPAAELGAGQVGSRASVPWSRIGPGWALAEYSTGSGGDGFAVKPGADTLYLVDPAGGRYAVATWAKNSPQTNWYLQAWSGDGQRALFAYSTASREQADQVDLRTGQVTSFWLPSDVSLLGYTRPDGLNIVAERGTGSTVSLLRYNLTGQLQQSLGSLPAFTGIAYQPAGAELAVGQAHGLALISNGGGVIRTLAIPGNTACSAERWWSADTILASCGTTSVGPRLWLVPANGSAPRALTPVRTDSSFDFGDFDAWQLSSGLYLDGYGACGTLVIGRQPVHGAETQLNVPGQTGSDLIVTATRSALLIYRMDPCAPGGSLIWLNPATKAFTVAVPAHGRQWGVIAAVPYFVTGEF
jgi:hypothetical protein